MYYILIPFFAVLLLITITMYMSVSVNIIYSSNQGGTEGDKKSKKQEKGDNGDNADLKVFVQYMFLTFYILPEKEKKKGGEKKPKTQKKSVKKATTIERLKKDVLSKEYEFSQIIEIIKQFASVLIDNFQKHLKLKIRSFVVVVASDDARKTALSYGTVTQTVYYLYEFLSHNLKVSYDDMKVYSDFSKTKTSYDIDMAFSIKLWHALKMIMSSVVKYQNIGKNNGGDKK